MDRFPQTSQVSGTEVRPQQDGLDTGPAQTDVEKLLQRFRALEQRVQALEDRLESNPARSARVPRLPAPSRIQPRQTRTGGIIPLFGEALLAIAGAYLLRALTEYKVVPLTLGVTTGVIYAFIWLLLGSKVAARKPLVGAIRGMTSALILVPLLWEATIQFGAFSTWTAAGVILGYSCCGLALSWRGNLAVTAWTTTLASVAAAATLLLATHDLVPFTLVLLALAAGMESSACFKRRLRGRWVVALAADLAILFVASIGASQGGAPEAYVPVSIAMALTLQIALPLIYLASTSLRVLGFGAILTGFETSQIVLALLLSITGALRIAHFSSAAREVVCAFSLLCGLLSYLLSFRFRRFTPGQGRNYYVYSTLGLLLVLTGALIYFSGPTLALLISAFALLCLLIAWWEEQVIFRWHAAGFLLLANMLSGLAGWAARNLLGAGFGWTSVPAAAAIAAIATVLAYAIIWEKAKRWSSFSPEIMPALAIAALATWAMAGLAAGALTGLCDAQPFSPLGTALRTFVLTTVAILLALSGMAWKRRELVWLVYPVMALIAYKLLLQDLLRGQTLALFVSFFLYGGALILLPRILQDSSPSP